MIHLQTKRKNKASFSNRLPPAPPPCKSPVKKALSDMARSNLSPFEVGCMLIKKGGVILNTTSLYSSLSYSGKMQNTDPAKAYTVFPCRMQSNDLISEKC